MSNTSGLQRIGDVIRALYPQNDNKDGTTDKTGT